MKKSLVLVGCLVICAAVLFAVTEQPLNVKPGLWQVERTITYSGLPLQYQAMLGRRRPWALTRPIHSRPAGRKNR